jgi:CRISPR/Cas system CSM-associated protein Csm4 (group 5 of RAMP superfamily)
MQQLFYITKQWKMNNTITMKKYSFNHILKTAILGFFISFTCQISFGQDRIENIKVEIKPVSSRSAEDGNITIQVISNNSPYTFSLFDKEPWNGGTEILSSSNIYDNSYTFLNISRGKYFVCVIDNEDNTRCQKATVSTK